MLAWLRGHLSEYNVFVANRTAEIQRKVPSERWRHVTSANNPADCASRGITSQQLRYHRLWWTGPQWMSDECNQWPPQPTSQDTTEELKVRAHNINRSAECWELLARYSSWSRLARITAYCMRFTKNCRVHRAAKSIGPLTTSELLTARDMWVRSVQAITYGDELRCIRNKLSISKSSSLKSLNPVLSTDNILCVGGRLVNAHQLPAAARTPAIIPRRSLLSALLINSMRIIVRCTEDHH